MTIILLDIGHSYWMSSGTKTLFSTVWKILDRKNITVTTLTFQGYVTSTVTWRFDSPYAIFIGGPSLLCNRAYLQAFSRYSAPNISGPRPWCFGSRDVTGTWPIDSSYTVSYRCSIVTVSLSPAVFEIMGPKYIGVTTLTFQGHVTSSVTWRFDSPYAISCRCSIRTEPLSLSVFEIFGSKHILVTTLTFGGYVTSSGMWPFDSPYTIS